MSWLIKEAIHALDSVIGGHGLAHCRVAVKVVSKSEPLVLQERYIFSGHTLGISLDNVRSEQWGLAAGSVMDLARVLGSESSSGHDGPHLATATTLHEQGQRLVRRVTQLYPHPTCFQPSGAPKVSGSSPTHHPAHKPHVVWPLLPPPPPHCPRTHSFPRHFPTIHPPNISRGLLDTTHFRCQQQRP